MTNDRREIVGSVELVLASLPAVTEAWEQEDVELAENTIQALLDNIAKIQTLPATARRLKQIAKRALVTDAKRAGETS